MSEHPLDPIFHPRAVALVGVPSTTQPGGGGAIEFLTSLLEQQFEKRHGVYPVNPKMSEVEGLRCYPTLLDTPDPVDHVISLVPARVAPDLVDHAIQKGVRSIHFFTAGFSETGDEQMARTEAEMIARLRAAGIRAIGPNCMGLYVPSEGLAFMSGFPREPGNVMLISQSGANAGDVVMSLARRGVRFSKVISFGNGSDLRAQDFFDYAAQDDETAVVTAYIEGVQDGRRFFEAVKRCAAIKPTILLKGGLTAAGARTAKSHTGSLAGSIEIFDAMCRQAGALRAETMEDLHDLVVALNTSVARVPGDGVGLVSTGGGYAVLSSDAIAAAGLAVPPLPEATVERLRELIPIAGTIVTNPVDSNAGPDAVEPTLKIVGECEPIDVVLTGPTFPRNPPARPGDQKGTPEEEARQAQESAVKAADQLRRLEDQTGTPYVAVMRERGGVATPTGEAFLPEAYRRGIAAYPSVARAARAIATVRCWRERRPDLPSTAPRAATSARGRG